MPYTSRLEVEQATYGMRVSPDKHQALQPPKAAGAAGSYYQLPRVKMGLQEERFYPVKMGVRWKRQERFRQGTVEMICDDDDARRCR